MVDVASGSELFKGRQKVKGRWTYLYRAVDKQGRTVDFLLSEKIDMSAAQTLFRQSDEEPWDAAINHAGCIRGFASGDGGNEIRGNPAVPGWGTVQQVSEQHD